MGHVYVVDYSIEGEPQMRYTNIEVPNYLPTGRESDRIESTKRVGREVEKSLNLPANSVRTYSFWLLNEPQ